MYFVLVRVCEPDGALCWSRSVECAQTVESGLTGSLVATPAAVTQPSGGRSGQQAYLRIALTMLVTVPLRRLHALMFASSIRPRRLRRTCARASHTLPCSVPGKTNNRSSAPTYATCSSMLYNLRLKSTPEAAGSNDFARCGTTPLICHKPRDSSYATRHDPELYLRLVRHAWCTCTLLRRALQSSVQVIMRSLQCIKRGDGSRLLVRNPCGRLRVILSAVAAVGGFDSYAAY